MKKIRVLVVDDSAFMRKVIKEMLSSDPELNVVETAKDGLDGLNKVKDYQPDVITLDVEMPRMDGLSMLKTLMEEDPLPVVMLSSLTQAGSETTMMALEAGAVDFVSKPSGTISLDIDKVKDELIKKIKVAAGARLRGSVKFDINKKKIGPEKNNRSVKKLITIGSSTGGPTALCKLISKIPGDIGCALAVVQHMPPIFTKTLSERLNRISEIEVREAKEGDELRNGLCLVAPGGYHLEIGQNGLTKLSTAPPVKSVRPSVDVLMSSAANAYGKNTVGVILTGMGNDGTVGMAHIKKVGGYTIAEDESTCVVFGMSRSVIEKGYADAVLPLDKIANKLVSITSVIN